MWSGRGRRLGTVPNGPAGEPERCSVVVRRAWLQEVLRDAAAEADVEIVFGARLAELREEIIPYYLGDLPDELRLPRRDTPRTRVPAGSVAIAGRQTAVYPAATPGGWRTSCRRSTRGSSS